MSITLRPVDETEWPAWTRVDEEAFGCRRPPAAGRNASRRRPSSTARSAAFDGDLIVGVTSVLQPHHDGARRADPGRRRHRRRRVALPSPPRRAVLPDDPAARRRARAGRGGRRPLRLRGRASTGASGTAGPPTACSSASPPPARPSSANGPGRSGAAAARRQARRGRSAFEKIFDTVRGRPAGPLRAHARALGRRAVRPRGRPAWRRTAALPSSSRTTTAPGATRCSGPSRASPITTCRTARCGSGSWSASTRPPTRCSGAACWTVTWCSHVKASDRPSDDPLIHLLAEPRRLNAGWLDDLWIRLVDVERALAARALLGAGGRGDRGRGHRLPVERPPLAPGRRHLRRPVRRPPTDPADLTLPVAVLGAAYLGGRPLAGPRRRGCCASHRPGAAAGAVHRDVVGARSLGRVDVLTGPGPCADRVGSTAWHCRVCRSTRSPRCGHGTSRDRRRSSRRPRTGGPCATRRPARGAPREPAPRIGTRRVTRSRRARLPPGFRAARGAGRSSRTSRAARSGGCAARPRRTAVARKISTNRVGLLRRVHARADADHVGVVVLAGELRRSPRSRRGRRGRRAPCWRRSARRCPSRR